MHLSIRIGLVLGIVFILLSCGFLPAIGQDSPQNPPGGYDKGVWVLTNKTPYFMYPNSDAPKRFLINGNSITVRYNWSAPCSEGGRPAYYVGTATWTELPPILYPGTKLETIMTVSMEGNPAPCSDGSWGSYGAPAGYGVALYNNFIDKYVKADITWADPKPTNSQKFTWDVPWGTVGKTIIIQMECSELNRASVRYTYTYQEHEASEPASQSLITGIDSEKQPLNVKLVVYPEETTDVDVIEIEADVSGDYKSPLNYIWYIDNQKLEGETGYKIRLESGVLPGEYLIKVQVTDDEGRTGEAWTTLNVIEDDTGIRGDVLEANLFDPIPNAIVSATSLKSGATKTVTVSPDGKYSIHLIPGNYKVSASAPGYLTESGTFGDDVKVLSPHDEPYCIDCYTTFNFRLVMEPANGGKTETNTPAIELDTTPPQACEIRGQVAGFFANGKSNLVDNSFTWNPQNFAGFYYDTEDDTGLETLSTTLTGKKLSGDSPYGVKYVTTAQFKEFKFEDWGAFNVMGFLTDRYFAGYVENRDNPEKNILFKESTDENSLSSEQLQKILIDDNTKKTVTSGTPLKLEEGYELAIKAIDIDGNKVYLELSKDGSVVDVKVVSPSKTDSTMSDKTYYYKNPAVGDQRKLVTIAVHFKNAFKAADQIQATIDGVWQISDSSADVKADTQYDKMTITSVDAITGTIIMENRDNAITLSKNMDTILMPGVNIRTVDDDNLRFYIYSKCEYR
jgi:S-layer protein (TIGR01567 family)